MTASTASTNMDWSIYHIGVGSHVVVKERLLEIVKTINHCGSLLTNKPPAALNLKVSYLFLRRPLQFFPDLTSTLNWLHSLCSTCWAKSLVLTVLLSSRL